MRVWIDKENEMHPNAEWNDSYVFTLTRKKYSTIFSGITDTGIEWTAWLYQKFMKIYLS